VQDVQRRIDFEEQVSTECRKAIRLVSTKDAANHGLDVGVAEQNFEREVRTVKGLGNAEGSSD